MNKSLVFVIAGTLILLPGCASHQDAANKNTGSAVSNAQVTERPAKKILPIPAVKPNKNCSYDINNYFENIEQYSLHFRDAKNWFNASNSEGKDSLLYNRFEKELHNFLNESVNNQKYTSLLRLEIGSNWVHSDNAYEIEWYRGKGIEISRLPPDKSSNFFYAPDTYVKKSFKCETTPVK